MHIDIKTYGIHFLVKLQSLKPAFLLHWTPAGLVSWILFEKFKQLFLRTSISYCFCVSPRKLSLRNKQKWVLFSARFCVIWSEYIYLEELTYGIMFSKNLGNSRNQLSMSLSYKWILWRSAFNFGSFQNFWIVCSTVKILRSIFCVKVFTYLVRSTLRNLITLSQSLKSLSEKS